MFGDLFSSFFGRVSGLFRLVNQCLLFFDGGKSRFLMEILRVIIRRASRGHPFVFLL